MGEPINPPVTAEGMRPSRTVGFARLNNPKFVASLFAGLIAMQAVGYLILGTGRSGRGFSGLLLCCHDLVALTCVWNAFRRARNTASLFWVLFGVTLLCLLVPSSLMAASTILQVSLVSETTWRVLFCLYGVPILMMLFLPEIDQSDRQRFQIFLDQFQV